ncbi:thioesterase family protein [Streptomyces sp. NPDC004126]|uniref:thioesterase family protein n=1 Tax=Streptomyces sp. NPDC004126 TaxID=3390695 RepID=UPI003D01A6A2
MRTESKKVTAHAVRVVAPSDCATQWGNDGLEVLSTPAILGNMERVCAGAMSLYLDAGEMSVGVNVTMNHRAPAPVGAEVEYRVESIGVDRKTEFVFEVRDAHGTLICDGTHARAVVEADSFQTRIDSPNGSVSHAR